MFFASFRTVRFVWIMLHTIYKRNGFYIFKIFSALFPERVWKLNNLGGNGQFCGATSYLPVSHRAFSTVKLNELCLKTSSFRIQEKYFSTRLNLRTSGISDIFAPSWIYISWKGESGRLLAAKIALTPTLSERKVCKCIFFSSFFYLFIATVRGLFHQKFREYTPQRRTGASFDGNRNQPPTFANGKKLHFRRRKYFRYESNVSPRRMTAFRETCHGFSNFDIFFFFPFCHRWWKVVPPHLQCFSFRFSGDRSPPFFRIDGRGRRIDGKRHHYWWDDKSREWLPI